MVSAGKADAESRVEVNSAPGAQCKRRDIVDKSDVAASIEVLDGYSITVEDLRGYCGGVVTFQWGI